MLIFSETMPTVVYINNFMACRGSGGMALVVLAYLLQRNTSLRALIGKSTAFSRLAQLVAQQYPITSWMTCHSAGANVSSGVAANLVN
jgi:hypothetical protein